MILTILFSLGTVGLFRTLLKGPLSSLDSKASFGISGLIGLGLLGSLTYFLGRLPQGLEWGRVLIVFLSGAGLVLFARDLQGKKSEVGSEATPKLELVQYVVVAIPVLFGLIALVGVLSPSTMSDWDTIAYHLAVPKIWLASKQITDITFIHHSNFPYALDGLFIHGLAWGGQAGAKAFSLVIYALGCVAIFGLARQWSNTNGGLVASCVFATIPSVMWESGTGYIDVGHGLYAGLGAWMLFKASKAPSGERNEPSIQRGQLILGGLLLGLAAGSKYTGLLTVGTALAIVPFTFSGELKSRIHGLVAVSLVVAVVAIPWYAKNAVTMNNPVYPFFYEKLGGKNWDQKQADVYKNEQKTFGVPFDGPLSIPHSIVGLAYQPGRYTNPNPKLVVSDGVASGGHGNPLASFGFVVMATGLVAGLLYAKKLKINPLLGWLLINVLAWFFLSQQSRYFLSFAPPLCIVAGLIFARRDVVGKLLVGAVLVQAVFSYLIAKDQLLTPQRLQSLSQSEDDFLTRSMPIYRAGKVMKEQPALGKVALYDEVFGFYLDVPYAWASFGHSTEFGYQTMKTPEELLESFRKQGITHVYLNLAMQDQAFAYERWIPSMGLALNQESRTWSQVEATPLDDAEKKGLLADVQVVWKPLLSDLVSSGKLEFVAGEPRWLLFRIP